MFVKSEKIGSIISLLCAADLPSVDASEHGIFAIRSHDMDRTINYHRLMVKSIFGHCDRRPQNKIKLWIKLKQLGIKSTQLKNTSSSSGLRIGKKLELGMSRFWSGYKNGVGCKINLVASFGWYRRIEGKIRR